MSERVEITRDEWELINKAGKLRYYQAIERRASNYWVGKAIDEELRNIVGCSAEFVVRKYLDLPRDLDDFKYHSKRDYGIDLSHKDITIQVKSSRYLTSRIILHRRYDRRARRVTFEEFRADFCVLVTPVHAIEALELWPGLPELEIDGFVSLDDWKKRHYQKDLGHGPTLIIDRPYRRPRELFEIVHGLTAKQLGFMEGFIHAETKQNHANDGPARDPWDL